LVLKQQESAVQLQKAQSSLGGKLKEAAKKAEEQMQGLNAELNALREKNYDLENELALARQKIVNEKHTNEE